MSWKHTFFEVDLKQVPWPEIDPHWTSSKSYSRDEINQWIQDLQEIQKRLYEQGWHDQDFRMLENSPDPNDQRLAKAHRNFYDHGEPGTSANCDFVKLDWNRDHYEIGNGQHRIWAAKEQGLKSIPAYVSAPDDATLRQLRRDGERATQEAHLKQRQPAWERTASRTDDRFRQR